MSTELNKKWHNVLIIKSNEYNATNIRINDTDIGDCKKINRDMRCDFICKCGKSGNKTIRSIVEKSRVLM